MACLETFIETWVWKVQEPLSERGSVNTSKL